MMDLELMAGWVAIICFDQLINLNPKNSRYLRDLEQRAVVADDLTAVELLRGRRQC